MNRLAVFSMIIATALPSGIAPAFAAPPRIEGQRCHFPHVKPGTWVGFFDGQEAQPRFLNSETYAPVTLWRCFNTKAECIAWKYWAQSDHRAGPQVTWCRKK